MRSWYKHWIAEGFEALEENAKRFSTDGRFMYCDRVTLADVCIVPQWHNARLFGCDLSGFSVLAGICTWLEAIPAFAAARPEAQPDADKS